MKPAADVYEELTVHLSRLGMGMPAREDLTDIIRRMFSPEEAEVALRLPTEVAPLQVASPEEVAERLGRPVEEVAGMLEGMASRGVAGPGREAGGMVYCRAALVSRRRSSGMAVAPLRLRRWPVWLRGTSTGTSPGKHMADLPRKRIGTYRWKPRWKPTCRRSFPDI